MILHNKMEATATKFINYDLSSALALESIGKPGGLRHRVLRRTDGKSTLPGQPWVKIGSGKLLDYLRRAFLTPDIDKVVPHLWLVSCFCANLRHGVH